MCNHARYIRIKYTFVVLIRKILINKTLRSTITHTCTCSIRGEKKVYGSHLLVLIQRLFCTFQNICTLLYMIVDRYPPWSASVTPSPLVKHEGTSTLFWFDYNNSSIRSVGACRHEYTFLRKLQRAPLKKNRIGHALDTLV